MGNAPWFENLFDLANAQEQKLEFGTGVVLVLIGAVIFYASNEMPLRIFHAVGNKTESIARSPNKPW